MAMHEISNISISRNNLVIGDTVTLKFTVKNLTGYAANGITVWIRAKAPGASGYDLAVARLAYVDSIPVLYNEYSQTFEYTFTIEDKTTSRLEDLIEALNSDPNTRALPIAISVSTFTNGSTGIGPTYTEIPGAYIMRTRCNPMISRFLMERAAISADGSYYLSDEGEYISATAKLAMDDPAESGNMALTLYYAEGREATQADASISLTGQISALLTGVTDSTSLIPGTFSNGSDWYFLLVFGDTYESTAAAYSIARAFANVHLSGAKTGGVCFGGFGTSTEGDPKLESYFPANFYAGIEGVTNYAAGEVKTGGTWIDGKPIYRSVIEIGAKTAAIQAVDVSDLNIETYIDLRGMFYAQSEYADGYVFPAPAATAATNYIIQLEAQNRRTIHIATTSRTWNSGFLIVEYTKTTD